MELLRTVCVVAQQEQRSQPGANGLDGDHWQSMRVALTEVELLCKRLSLDCRRVEYTHLDYGSTEALQNFYDSDLAIVDMTVKTQRYSLLHQIKIRHSMGLMANIVLLSHTSEEDTESVRSMLSETDRFVAYTVAADASPDVSVGDNGSNFRCLVVGFPSGGGGRLYGRLKRLVKEQRRCALARRQATYLAELREILQRQQRPELEPAQLRAHLAAMRPRLDDPELLSTEVLLGTLLAYRKAQDYAGMVSLIEVAGEPYTSSVGVQYYYAFALNRRNRPGDRERALFVASAALRAAGEPVPSLLGLLGRIHKDLFTDSDCRDAEALRQSLHWYRQTFQAQPNEFTGANLAAMLLAAGEGDGPELQRVAMVITAMLGRRGSVETLTDYWLVATFFEVSALTRNYAKACLAAACMHRLDPPLWHLRATLDKVALLHRFQPPPSPTRERCTSYCHLFSFWLQYFREMAAEALKEVEDEEEEDEEAPSNGRALLRPPPPAPPPSSPDTSEAPLEAEFLALLVTCEAEATERPVRVLVGLGCLSIRGVLISTEAKIDEAIGDEASAEIVPPGWDHFWLSFSEDQVRRVCLTERSRRTAFLFTLGDDLRLLFAGRSARAAFYAAVAARLPSVARGAEPRLLGAFEPVSLADLEYETTPSGQRRVLGRGSYGVVYSAIERKRQMKIAVKEIAEDRVPHVQALHEEIRLHSRLYHRNIVGLLGSLSESGVVNIFMEQVPGGSLSALIKRVGPLREDTTAHYSHQILEGLRYLHENRIVHRDIKSDNILVNAYSGIIKITDFGTSRRLTGLDNAVATFAGTFRYMSPEAANLGAEGYGYPTDVWSFGCTAVEMLSGQPPFSELATSQAALFEIGMHRRHPNIPAGCSDACRDFCMRCFAPDPAQRATCVQLLADRFLADADASSASAAAGSHPSEDVDSGDQPDPSRRHRRILQLYGHDCQLRERLRDLLDDAECRQRLLRCWSGLLLESAADYPDSAAEDADAVGLSELLDRLCAYLLDRRTGRLQLQALRPADCRRLRQLCPAVARSLMAGSRLPPHWMLAFDAILAELRLAPEETAVLATIPNSLEDSRLLQPPQPPPTQPPPLPPLPVTAVSPLAAAELAEWAASMAGLSPAELLTLADNDWDLESLMSCDKADLQRMPLPSGAIVRLWRAIQQRRELAK